MWSLCREDEEHGGPVGRSIIIGVIGGREASAEVALAAEAVGQEIARAGARLICGGYGGVMAAACRGATGAGGETIGVLMGDHCDDANPWVTIPIATGLGEARNLIIVRTADVLIAVDGGYGTLMEIAAARCIDKPVVGLHSWQVKQKARGLDGQIELAHDPVDAVSRALHLARTARRVSTGAC